MKKTKTKKSGYIRIATETIIIILLLLSIILVEGIIVEPGREWELGNETYTVNQTMDFSRVIVSEDDDYMYENNTIFSSFGNLPVYGSNQKGQQFTIGTNQRDMTFNITQTTVWCRRVGTPPTPCYVSIYNTDGSGHPTGNVLSQGTFDPSGAMVGNPGTQYNITMSNAKLLSSTMYAIILNATGGDSSNCIYLRDAAGDWYTGGNRLSSYDGGISWESNVADAFFEIYGTTNYLCFNNTGFNVTSSNTILITLDYINEDIKNVAGGDKVLGFYADTIINDVWMNISGFSIDTTYDVYRDDVLHDSYTTDSSGMLFIFSSSWSEHLFNVYLEVNSAPIQSNPSPNNESIDVGVSTGSVSVTVNDADGDSLDWTIETYPSIGSDSGSGEGNGVKSCSISGLTYDVTYTWYVNVTDGTDWTNNSYWFTTESNTVPSISNPNPVNGSTGVSVDTSSISVTIADSETSFNWTITTSPDIGSDSDNDETDGTKTCTVAGLSYDAVYYWTVTAYDGLLWTNTTYHFTVESDPGGGPPPNSAPVISEEYPEDESTLQVLTPICHFLVTDANIDTITVNIYNSTDGITYYWQQKNDSVPTGTTIYWNYSQASEYNTLYYWRVYANDGTINISRIFSFTTYPNNPMITSEIPADGAVDVTRNTSVSITIIDYQGDTMNITWRSNSSGSWVDFGYNNSIGNGTYSKRFINSTDYNTQYWWSVNISDDNGGWTNDTYSFTTEVNNAPIISDPIPRDGKQSISIYTTNLSVLITDANSNFNYTIETYPDIGSNTAYGVGSGVKGCTVSGLNHSTVYTWYVNATDGIDWTNESYTFTTKSSTDFDIEGFKLNLPEWAVGPYKVYVGDFIWMILFVGVIAIAWGSSEHISTVLIVILLMFAAYGSQRVFVDNSEISLLFSVIAAVCVAAIMLGLFLKKRYG